MADISPDLAARIESLKASHAENPARFFMPLASAYREAGEIGRAEELLRENLKRHPGYLSAHVLLGRCLADRGAVAEARNEFQYVLSVDSQNLIALRTLGDMAAAGGDAAEARRWYNELLAVDPMNADARQALSGLDSLPAPSAPPAGAPAAEAEEGGFGMVDLDDAPAPGGEPADFGAWGEVSLDAAPASSAPNDASAFVGETPSSGPAGWGEVDLSAEPAPSAPSAGEPAGAGFDALDFGAVDFSSPSSSEPEASDDRAGAASSSDAGSFDAGGFDAWGSVDDGQLDAPSSAGPLDGLEGYYAEDAPHEGDEGEVVTETMAELYARQGFTDRAADVYRELISRRGAEPALVRRLEELEAEMRGQDAPAAPHVFDAGALDFAPADESGPPAWLQAVDAASSAPSVGLPDVGVEHHLPDLDLRTDLDAPPAIAREEADVFASSSGAGSFGAADEEDHDDYAGSDRLFIDDDPAPALAAAESTGDPFADSFARGFAGVEAGAGDAEPSFASASGEDASADAGLAAAAAEAAGAFEDDRAAWEPPTVEETEPVAAPGLPSPDPIDAPAETAAPVQAEAAPSFAAAQGGGTIRAYMASLLTWRPGAAQAAASPAVESAPADAAPSVDAAQGSEFAPSAFDATPGFDETSGFDATPDFDAAPGFNAAEPEDAAPAADFGPTAEAEPWAAERSPWEAPAPDEAEEPAPWEAPSEGDVGGEEPAPWEAPAAPEEAEAGADDLPWMDTSAPAGFEAVDPAPSAGSAPREAARGDDPMPWDTPFDLAGEAAETPMADRAAPRPEPTVEETAGFSFEDFFSAPAEPAGPAPSPALEPSPSLEPVFEPEPEPQPPTASAPQSGGEDDEDLESFQAWLQSLKR